MRGKQWNRLFSIPGWYISSFHRHYWYSAIASFLHIYSFRTFVPLQYLHFHSLSPDIEAILLESDQTLHFKVLQASASHSFYGSFNLAHVISHDFFPVICDIFISKKIVVTLPVSNLWFSHILLNSSRRTCWCVCVHSVRLSRSSNKHWNKYVVHTFQLSRVVASDRSSYLLQSWCLQSHFFVCSLSSHFGWSVFSWTLELSWHCAGFWCCILNSN